jgi:uncharacterized membrane protein YgaE (UPF0421/DUF939 family)
MKTFVLTSSVKSLVYPARTTIAAVLALFVAKALGLPEVYWAPISALVVVQSDLGSSLKTSRDRLVGTALGVFTGAVLAIYVGRTMPVYGLGVFGVGALSAFLRLEKPANRFAAIALSIVLLIARTESAWVVAFHRFVEVSTGIMAGLLVSALWPEEEVSATRQQTTPAQ